MVKDENLLDPGSHFNQLVLDSCSPVQVPAVWFSGLDDRGGKGSTPSSILPNLPQTHLDTLQVLKYQMGRSEYFELTEMLNETNPHGSPPDDAILVISASSNHKESGYEYLLQYVSNSNKDNPLPFYIVRRINNIFMHTYNQI